MAAINDILECTFNYSQGNRTANIVQFLKVTASVGGSVLESDIGYTLDEAMKDLWVLWGHTTASYNGLRLVNRTNGINYDERIDATAGGISGDPAAPFIAISIKQQVPTLITRAGFKRLPFISEAQMNGTNWVIGGTQETAILNFFSESIEVLFEADPETPSAEFVKPVIVGRTLNEEVPPYYELDLSKVQLISNAQSVGITSQNSRKR